jgi:hypothetical protein
VRAIAILVVVAGHGFLAVVSWRNGVPRAGNVLAGYPNGQLITWLFQVMPLFFFAGGYSNSISWEHRGERDYAQWMWARTRRLLRPLWGYLAVMLPVALIVGALAPVKVSSPLLIIATQLLWFLGIYLVITALTPVLVRMERRYDGLLIIGSLLAIALIDLARLHDVGGPIALLNFVFVWSLLASLGMRYRRGRLGQRSGALLALTALAINIAIVLVFEWYPRSMVGMPGDRISNVAPPTFALTMHGIVVIGLVAMAAGALRPLKAVARVWRATVLINIVMMTIYLWHLPALMAIFLIERAIGFERPTTILPVIGPVPADGFWWASPGHWIAFLLVVGLVVRVLWPLEYARIPVWDRRVESMRGGRAAMSAIGATLIGVALLMLSAAGLTVIPLRTITYLGVPINALMALALLIAGAALVRGAVSTRRASSS